MASGPPPGMGPPAGVIPDSDAPNLSFSYDTFLEIWMLSVILSAIAYGIVVTLTWSCIELLRTVTWTASKQRTYFLLLYILVMLGLSTGSIASSIITMTTAVFAKQPFENGNPLGNLGTVCMVLANWSADGFLLWRCIMLYRGVVSDGRRRASYVGIGILGFLSFVVGTVYLRLTAIGTFLSSLSLFAFACTSLFVNLAITSLITIRITHLGSAVKATFGRNHMSIYRRIVSMVVESAALVVFVYLAYVVLTVALPIKMSVPLKSLAGLIPMMSLTQTYVIATLLIVYRVAQRRDAENSPVHTQSGSSRTRTAMSLNFAGTRTESSRIELKPIEELPLPDSWKLQGLEEGVSTQNRRESGAERQQ